MILTTQSDLMSVNEKFNSFHDGIFYQAEVVSRNKFMLNFRWEPKPTFASKEQEIAAIYRSVCEARGVSIKINHHNYNYPFESYKRMIAIQAPRATCVFDSIAMFVGRQLFEVGFTSYEKLVECYIIYHDNPSYWSRENGFRRVLFRAPKIRVIEC